MRALLSLSIATLSLSLPFSSSLPVALVLGLSQPARAQQPWTQEELDQHLAGFLEGGVIALRSQLKAGDRVVNAPAAAKLFSREFHRPPLPVGTENKVDDDDD